MPKIYHEALRPLGNLGIQVSTAALDNPHVPLHWHEAMEILFCLNGEATVHVDHEAISLPRNRLIVFDSKEVHAIHSTSKIYMFLCIHIDKKMLSLYFPDLELYSIRCRPLSLDDPKSTEYLHLCQLARELTRINVENESTSAMRSDGTALLMLSDLIKYFSVSASPGSTSIQRQPNDTIREIISYVTEHYREKITLDQMAARTGFSREYFCRFFKQHMGITFLRYLNEVRISHAGRLLNTTELSIFDIMAESGFTNQTLFNQMFKEIYGITPRQARKLNKVHSTAETIPQFL